MAADRGGFGWLGDPEARPAVGAAADRPEGRAGPGWLADFDDAVAELPVSADATAGIATIAAPMPSAVTDAPAHRRSLDCPVTACHPPNFAGSVRTSVTAASDWFRSMVDDTVEPPGW
ncbi:hypothetical protein B1R94_06750 [Mycolicibacterium litorale]|nr:hypothetical protein B1R94_06750 [Mycolicibacterium litorale]